MTPSASIAVASSPMRCWPSASSWSAARWASSGTRTSPSSPSVQVTRVTWAPSAAYCAIVAPLPIVSSSGCACTSSSRGAASRARPSTASAAGVGLLEHRLGLAQHGLLGRWSGRASGSSASGPSGVVVMTATLPSGHRTARSVGRRAMSVRRRRRHRPTTPTPSPAPERPHPAVHPRRAARLCSSTPTAAGCCSSAPRHGTDPVGPLWSLDVATGDETLLADPRDAARRRRRGAAPPPSGPAASAAARARRASSATPPTGGATVAAFALSGRLWVAGPDGGGAARELPAAGAVIDPRPDPTGTWVAYAADGALHVVRVDGTRGPGARPRRSNDEVTWGLAEFVAAEEMGRYRGYWWSPDGAHAAGRAGRRAARCQRWYIADPATPGDARRPSVALPGGRQRQRRGDAAPARPRRQPRPTSTWDRSAFPYLVQRRLDARHGDRSCR